MDPTQSPASRRGARRGFRAVAAAATAAVALAVAGLPAGAAGPPPTWTPSTPTSTTTPTSSPTGRPPTIGTTPTPTPTSSTTTTTTAPPSTTEPAPTPPTATAPGEAPGDANAADGRYIVTLKPDASPETMAGESRRRGDRIEHVYRWASRGFSGELSGAEVARLRSDPRVERIEPDQVVYAIGTQSPAPSWGLDRIDERARDATSAYVYPSTGAGVTAYVIDTGIYAGSADLAGRVAAGRNFVASGGTVNASATNDCNGHGTHVAGTIGGTTYGVAKAVTLVPVRVLNCTGSGYWSDVIAGIDWVTAQHTTGKAVANLSLGGGYSQSVNDAVARAVADGVVVAVAAGNSNASACNSSPASAPSALTVGATDASDNRASFSNYGSCVDLFAPGVNITSDWIGSSGATNTISGTSMASPHVAGVAALYLEVGKTAADLMGDVTVGLVVNPGSGSPNKLLYLGSGPCTSCSTTTTSSTSTTSTSTTSSTTSTTTTTTSPPAQSTGWLAPTANAAQPGGDGNGYETNPANAYADDGVYAVDTNSGTGTSTSCTGSTKDKHAFSGFGIAVPSNAKGIEVQVQAKTDSASGSPKLCLQLSWDGGTTWTSVKATTFLGTTERTMVVGGTKDLWGRSPWTPAQLADLRVRVVDVSSSTVRDFSLDSVAVRVTY